MAQDPLADAQAFLKKTANRPKPRAQAPTASLDALSDPAFAAQEGDIYLPNESGQIDPRLNLSPEQMQQAFDEANRAAAMRMLVPPMSR